MKLSRAAAVFLVVMGALVVFSVSTNSRNSILIKEYLYVAGGSLAGLVLGILVLTGTPLHLGRIPRSAAGALLLVVLLMLAVHLLGPISSVNGPFTMASLTALALLGALGAATITPRHRLNAALAMTGISMAVFLYALLQGLGVSLFPWDAGLTRTGRVSGSLGNPNLLGAYSAAMIPLGASAILAGAGWKRSRAVLAGLFVLTAVAAVIESGTRGSLIGVFSGAVFMAAWLLARPGVSRRNRILAPAAAGLLVALSVLPMRSRVSEVFRDQGESGTAQVRKVIWSGGLESFRERPLAGWGPGSFQIVFPRYRDPRYSILGVSHNTLHAHCEYIEILGDIGIAGLFLWGVFGVSMARRMKGAGLLTAGAAAGAVSMLAENLVSVSLRWPPTAWLFAFLCTVYLTGGDDRAARPSKTTGVFLGSGLVIVSSLLGIVCLSIYPGAMEAARLVFSGKDYHLTATESPMNSASSFARAFVTTGDPNAAAGVTSAWASATLHADSAIALCGRAVQADSSDLSARYALGSAYLTRAILANPTDPNVATALQYNGRIRPDPAASRRYNQLGMDTYNALTSMAPDYAETHNNLAIGYLALGNAPACLEELYVAWRLHGHRRPDYFQQTLRMNRVVPGSRGAALLIWSHLLEELDTIVSDGRNAKAGVHMENLVMISWFLERASGSSGDFSGELTLLAGEYGQDLPRTLDSISAASPSPDSLYSSAMMLLQTGSAHQGLPLMVRLHELQNGPGAVAPTAWPDRGSGYQASADAVVELHWVREVWDPAFSELVNLLRADQIVNSALNLATGQMASSVRPEVRETLEAMSSLLGGPGAAVRAGSSRPWLPGSMADRLETSLQEEAEADPGNPAPVLLQLRFYFLGVTSFWWEGSVFFREQNGYLLDRLFASRDEAARLLGSESSAEINRVLEEETRRVESLVPPVNLHVLDDLRRDLAGMLPRTPPP